MDAWIDGEPRWIDGCVDGPVSERMNGKSAMEGYAGRGRGSEVNK